MNSDAGIDETPTHTRFIGNCEDIGLFQELQLNPFDETFRIAVENSTNDISNVLRDPLSKSDDQETLNTPKVISLVQSNNLQNIYAMVDEDDGDDFMMDPDHFLVESVEPESTSADRDNLSEESTEIEVIEEPIQQNGYATPSPTSVNNIVSTLTSNGANTVTYTINGDAIKNGTIGNFILQTAPPVSSNNNSLRYNSINKPLILPKTAIVPAKNKSVDQTPKFTASNVLKEVTGRGSEFLYQLSNAKLLQPTVSGKNVVLLRSRNNPSTPSTSQPVRRAVRNEEQTVQRVVVNDDVREKLKDLLSTNPSQLVDEPILGEGRKRTQTEGSNSSISVVDDKKEYSRERNRMAQKRCRMKKKSWYAHMMNQSELMSNEKKNLESQVSELQTEVANLKTLLLAHRNCSVTRAMYKRDLSDILNHDLPDFAENITIPIPKNKDDHDETKIKFQQVNHVNVHGHQHVNQHIHQIHLHVPPSLQPSEDTFEPLNARRGSGPLDPKQPSQTKKLIFDSKVVPIKPYDRSASVLHTKQNNSMRPNVLTVSNADEVVWKQLNVVTGDGVLKNVSGLMMAECKPTTQSAELSASVQCFRIRASDLQALDIKPDPDEE